MFFYASERVVYVLAIFEFFNFVRQYFKNNYGTYGPPYRQIIPDTFFKVCGLLVCTTPRFQHVCLALPLYSIRAAGVLRQQHMAHKASHCPQQSLSAIQLINKVKLSSSLLSLNLKSVISHT